MSTPLFRNRLDAGEALARRLLQEDLPAPRVVLALPRGGVPIGAVLARRLGAALDLLLVRKIGAPWQPELAVAAVVDAGTPELVVDDELALRAGADAGYIERRRDQEWGEILRRRTAYLSGRVRASLAGATVIVVDDGIATGTTMRAALRALQRSGAARLVVAVPVASTQALDALREEVDRVVCLAEPWPFRSIGEHYADFHQVGDGEVLAALAAADGAGGVARDAASARTPGPGISSDAVVPPAVTPPAVAPPAVTPPAKAGTRNARGRPSRPS